MTDVAPASAPPIRAVAALSFTIACTSAAAATAIVGFGLSPRGWPWSDASELWGFVHVSFAARVLYHLIVGCWGVALGLLGVQRRALKKSAESVGTFASRLLAFFLLLGASMLVIAVLSLFPPEKHSTGGGGLAGLVGFAIDAIAELLFGAYHAILVAIAGVAAYLLALGLTAVCMERARRGDVAEAEAIAAAVLAGAIFMNLVIVGIEGLPFFGIVASLALVAGSAYRAARRGKKAAVIFAVLGVLLAGMGVVLTVSALRWERDRERRAALLDCGELDGRKPIAGAAHVVRDSDPKTGAPKLFILPQPGRTAAEVIDAAARATGACRTGNRFTSKEITPVFVAATPAALDVTVTIPLLLPRADAAEIERRAERDVREAFDHPDVRDRGWSPLVKLPASVRRDDVKCVDPLFPSSICRSDAMVIDEWDVGRYPVIGKLVVRTAPIDGIDDYTEAGRMAGEASYGSFDGADLAEKTAAIRARVLLALGYDEHRRDEALDKEDAPAAESARDAALAQYTKAKELGGKAIGSDSDPLDAAVDRPDALGAWLRRRTKDADADALVWTGLAWLGASRMEDDQDRARTDRRVAEPILARAREIGRAETWALATAGLAIARARATPGKLDAAARLFDEALRKKPRNAALVSVLDAAEIACPKGDRAARDRLLAAASAGAEAEPLGRWERAVTLKLAASAATDARWKRCAPAKP